jgi:hypothetical protein
MHWIYSNYCIYYEKIDKEYTSGHIAIQGHNPGMKIEARELYYRKVSE